MYKGWLQIGFERDIKYGINRMDIEDHSILIIKQEDSIRAFDASCPHRGANLCDGKLIDDDFIICAFHGCHIGIGGPGREGLRIKRYASYVIGGLVFINLYDTNDNGFKKFITELEEKCFIIPGFEMKVKALPEMVIENAFDQMHFRTVHSILNEPVFTGCAAPDGAYGVEGVFDIPPSKWHQKITGNKLSVPYKAFAFSPYLVVSLLAGPDPYYVITSAIPVSGKETSIRLSIAVMPDENNMPPRIDLCQYLLDQSKKGLELDKKIWEGLPVKSIQKFLKAESAVIQFQQFCKSSRHNGME